MKLVWSPKFARSAKKLARGKPERLGWLPPDNTLRATRATLLPRNLKALWFSRPLAERAPWMVLRLMTIGRKLRSA